VWVKKQRKNLRVTLYCTITVRVVECDNAPEVAVTVKL
jgi:hypothetical protein